MMSLEVIQYVNNDIARRAARHNLVPYVFNGPTEVDESQQFPLPNLGYYGPPGWQQVESWFVDKTGVGRDGEPALSQRQFKEVLRNYILQHPTHGFAIVEESEFQVVIGAFARG